MNKFIFLLSIFILLLISQLYLENFFLIESLVILSYIFVLIFFRGFYFDSSFFFSLKNIVLFVYTIRLAVIPFFGMFLGYHSYFDSGNTSNNSNISLGYFVIFASFLGFCIGYHLYKKSNKSDYYLKYLASINGNKLISLLFILFGLTFILLSFRSFDEYIYQIFVKEKDIQNIRNPFLNLGLIFSKVFIPFGLVLWLKEDKIHSVNSVRNIFIFLFYSLLIIFFSLGSNRQSMLYPVFALFATMCLKGYFKVNFLFLVIVSIPILYFVYLYSFYRSSNLTGNTDLDFDFNQLYNDIQIYSAGPSTFEPILLSIKENYFTFFVSFFQNLPLFKDIFSIETLQESYNFNIYKTYLVKDQVLYTYIELYYNGGVFLVFLSFVCLGFISKKLDLIIFASYSLPIFVLFSIYYLILLFNGFFILGISVVGQLFIYSSLPSIIILLLYKPQRVYDLC